VEFDEYAALGKKIKLAKPEYRKFSDEEVGVVYIQKHGLPSVNSHAWVFLEWRTEHIRKQQAFASAQFDQAFNEAILPLQWASKIENYSAQAEGEHIRIRQQLQQLKIDFDQTVRAYDAGVSRATFEALQQRQAEYMQDLMKLKAEAQLEVEKSRMLAEIDIWKQAESNRLDLEHLERAANIKARLRGPDNRTLNSGRQTEGPDTGSES
jgi:hypothetical protein